MRGINFWNILVFSKTMEMFVSAMDEIVDSRMINTTSFGLQTVRLTFNGIHFFNAVFVCLFLLWVA